MSLVFHPLVQRDVSVTLRFYEEEGGRALADRFWGELEDVIAFISREPRGGHFVGPGIRRANLKTFPYHLLYREIEGQVRVLVLRHHRRDPRFGAART